MTNLSDVFEPRGIAAPTAVSGYVAAVDGDDVYAILPAFDASHRWGPLFGVPAGTTLTRGDECLVVFDEDREPWYVAPAAGGTSGGGTDVDVNATASASTLAPGANASVVVTEPSSNLFDFAFGIPRGNAGAQGAQGPAGAAGATGSQGPKGDTGAQGVKGDTGAQGSTGSQGPKGDTGTQGPAGAQGAQGVQGVQGDTGYETAPIGTTLSWTGKTLPSGYVLADGARYAQGLYPQGYTFAKQEADAGNALWTYRTSDSTFTVPDLRDRFLLNAGASYAFGINGGEINHLLSGAESGTSVHGHADTLAAPAHTHPISPSAVAAPGQVGAVGTTYNVGTSTVAATGAASATALTGGVTNSTAANAASAHNNMPPYVAIAQMVKVAGVTISAGSITGPPGPQGPAGPIGADGPQGPTGPQGPAALQPTVTVRHSATQSIATSTYVMLAWDSEVEDLNGFHDTAVNNSRVTVPAGMGGLYLVSWHVWFPSNATNARYLRVLKNKAGVATAQDEWGDVRAGVTGLATVWATGYVLRLAAGDYIEISAWQNSGSALVLPANAPYYPQLSMTRLTT